MVKVATAFPAPVYRTSGSLPRFPSSITLFKDLWAMPASLNGCIADCEKN